MKTFSDPSQDHSANDDPPLEPDGFEEQVIRIFVDISKAFGLPRSHAEIYGLLFASSTPQSFSEIEHKLKLSKGSVSQGLRALRNLGAVSVSEAVPTGKTTVSRYHAVLELKRSVKALLQERALPQLDFASQRLTSLEQKLETSNYTPEAKQRLRKRTEKLKSWRKNSANLIQVVTKFLQ